MSRSWMRTSAAFALALTAGGCASGFEQAMAFSRLNVIQHEVKQTVPSVLEKAAALAIKALLASAGLSLSERACAHGDSTAPRSGGPA